MSLISNERIYFFFSHFDTINDEFLDGLDLINLEEMILKELKKQGYKRILFYNGVDGLYAYDEKSLRKKKTSLRKSLGSLRKDREKELKLQRAMSEEEFVKYLETVIKSKEKTAVIITDLFAFLEHSSREVLKELNQIFIDIKQLSAENENKLIFLDPTNSKLDMIKEKLSQIRGIPNLTTSIFRNIEELKITENVIFLDLPYQDEIRNLINYLRIKKSKEVNFLEIERIVDELFKYSRQNQKRLKDIHFKIKNSPIKLDDILDAIGEKKELRGFEKLDKLKGVENTKVQIEGIVKNLKNKKKKEVKLDTLRRFSTYKEPKDKRLINIILTGNPGTGKTTIAEIIGEIFKEEGILEGGQFIKVSKSDLVGEHVGETAIKTRAQIEKAKGGVLFIDEAYALAEDEDFGKEAINELVAAMTEYYSDLCVIAAGYPDDMENFLKSNEGLKSRFPYKIHIDDYTPEILEAIFDEKSKHLKLSREVKEIKKEYFKNFYQKRTKTSGNARFIDTLVAKLESNMVLNNRDYVSIDDFSDEFSEYLPAKYKKTPSVSKILEELDKYVGFDEVKKDLSKIFNSIIVSKKKNKAVYPPHIALLGNPGTGKTTVAEIIYRFFKEVGLLKGDFIKVKRADLVAGYVGQSALKTREVLEKAKGGVLFIDEAYDLVRGEKDFGHEVVTEIIDFMEFHRGEISVILAGYKEPILKFIETNPGFKSRINSYIYLRDYNEDELFEIFKFMLKERGLKITPEALKEVKRIITNLVKNKEENFANAREIRKLVDLFETNLNDRLANMEDFDTIKEDDERLYLITVDDVRG